MTESIEPYMFLPYDLLPPNSLDEIEGLDFRFESARLESFKGWPCSWMKPEKLAAAGFYYTGDGDKVKCFDCLIEIYKWQADDDPMVDHQRFSRRSQFGNCRFVSNIPCDNVPIGTDPNAIPAPEPKGVDVFGPYNLTYVPSSGPDHKEERENLRLRGLASRSKHPEHASYPARLASFDRWPKAMSQTKEELAAAGFYYTGSGDQILCFHCGGGLRDWEPQDDPWVEHAKWFGYCPYLILIRGTKFISNITGRTYIATENLPNTATDKLDEIFEKADDESIASGSSQNSVNFDETNNTEASASGEVSSKEQSVQIPGDKPCDKDAKLCKICYSRDMRLVFMPCGHLLACEQCAKNMKICGVCRKPVELTIQVYIS